MGEKPRLLVHCAQGGPDTCSLIRDLEHAEVGIRMEARAAEHGRRLVCAYIDQCSREQGLHTTVCPYAYRRQLLSCVTVWSTVMSVTVCVRCEICPCDPDRVSAAGHGVSMPRLVAVAGCCSVDSVYAPQLLPQ